MCVYERERERVRELSEVSTTRYYIYIYIHYKYFVIHRECFVALQLFSVARHAGCFQLGWKPAQILYILSTLAKKITVTTRVMQSSSTN